MNAISLARLIKYLKYKFDVNWLKFKPKDAFNPKTRIVPDRYWESDAVKMSAKCFIERKIEISGHLLSFEYSPETNSLQLILKADPWFESPIKSKSENIEHSSVELSRSESKLLRIEGIGIRSVCFTGMHYLEDIFFTNEHPELWKFEQKCQIFCNSNFNKKELFDFVSNRKMHCINRSELSILLLINPDSAPFAISEIPFSIFHEIIEFFDATDVKYYCPSEPKQNDELVALLLDGGNHIIASDFIIHISNNANY